MRRAGLSRAGLGRSENPEAEVSRIEEALRRIDDGRYGICDACGAAIGAQVLLANPASSLCSGCARDNPSHWPDAQDVFDGSARSARRV